MSPTAGTRRPAAAWAERAAEPWYRRRAWPPPSIQSPLAKEEHCERTQKCARAERARVAASAAGLGAADLAASGVAVASASSGSGSQAATGLTEAVLVAFRSHRLVK
jgi:hypothetical protein